MLECKDKKNQSRRATICERYKRKATNPFLNLWHDANLNNRATLYEDRLQSYHLI